MRNQTEKILRLLCWGLAVLVILQLARAAFRATALTRVAITAVPTLSTNEPADGKADESKSGPASATNAVPNKAGTNVVSSTNTMAATNLAAVPTTNVAPVKPATNTVVSSTNILTATNQLAEATNVPTVLMDHETNVIAGTNTNSVAIKTQPVGTNFAMTNSLALTDPNGLSVTAGTNSAPPAKKKAKKKEGDSAPTMAMPGGPSGRPGKPGSSLPPEVQPRVDKIVDSEMFAPVMRPQPMALQGIAGDVAFLRSPSGQTGLVKEGDSLGELKLLRIGINRVLVEVNGEKKELTVFDGYGSESLLPK